MQPRATQMRSLRHSISSRSGDRSELRASDTSDARPDSPQCRQTRLREEFQVIVADIRQQQFNANAKDSGDFVEFIGLAGLGQAEAAHVTLPDIHFERGEMTTFRHKTRQGSAVPITQIAVSLRDTRDKSPPDGNFERSIDAPARLWAGPSRTTLNFMIDSRIACSEDIFVRTIRTVNQHFIAIDRARRDECGRFISRQKPEQIDVARQKK